VEVARMGEKDRQNIDRIINASEHRKRCEPLFQKDIAEYMGVPATTLSYWLKQEENCLKLEHLTALTETLHTLDSSKFEANVLKTLQDTALDITTEMLAKKMKSVCKHRIMGRMKKNDAIRLLDGATSITFAPSDTLAISDALAEIFKPELVPPLVNLFVNPQYLPETITTIERWAYSSEGDFSRHLDLNVFTSNAATVVGMLVGSMGEKCLGFMEDDDGSFIQLPDSNCCSLMNNNQYLIRQQCTWSLLRTPEARVIRRFLRSAAPEKLSGELVAFLEEKVVYHESLPSATIRKSGNILEDLTEEIEKIFGAQTSSQYSKHLRFYWLAFEVATISGST